LLELFNLTLDAKKEFYVTSNPCLTTTLEMLVRQNPILRRTMPLDECIREPQPTPGDDAASSRAPNSEATDFISDQARYSRQVLFPGIGQSGQQMLAQSHVAIVGCGATGAAAASLLARAGVGALTLIDRDFVEPSNLQRQVLYDESDAHSGLPKAEAARRHIARFNSSVTVHAHIADLVPANIAELLIPATHPRPQIILDATDNFETRYLINDFAVQQSIPWIYAAAIGAYAATMNILPNPPIPSKSPRAEGPVAESPGAPSMAQSHRDMGGTQTSHTAPEPASTNPLPLTTNHCPTACLACIFPIPPSGDTETCDTAGILSTAVNLAASIQVTEALKFLTGQPHLMRRTLISFELWSPKPGNKGQSANALESAEISAATPRPDCTVCGQRIFTHLAGENRPHITLCGRDSVQIHEHHHPVDFAAMRARLAAHSEVEDLRSNSLLLRFRRGSQTLTLFADGRAIIQGTTNVALARSLYARFVGA
jgi:molybdopterin/thiamine biosynthesis adenylyltransferase